MTATKLPNKAYLTLEEAADYLDCSSKTLRRAVKAKKLPHHRFGIGTKRGGKIYISALDLQNFLGKCRVAAAV